MTSEAGAQRPCIPPALLGNLTQSSNSWTAVLQGLAWAISQQTQALPTKTLHRGEAILGLETSPSTHQLSIPEELPQEPVNQQLSPPQPLLHGLCGKNKVVGALYHQVWVHLLCSCINLNARWLYCEARVKKWPLILWLLAYIIILGPLWLVQPASGPPRASCLYLPRASYLKPVAPLWSTEALVSPGARSWSMDRPHQ